MQSGSTRLLRNVLNFRYELVLSVRSYVKGHFVDPLSSNLRTEGNFQARVYRRKSIGFPKLYGLTSSFLSLRKYFDTHFRGQCVMPGFVHVWWVV